MAGYSRFTFCIFKLSKELSRNSKRDNNKKKKKKKQLESATVNGPLVFEPLMFLYVTSSLLIRGNNSSRLWYQAAYIV